MTEQKFKAIFQNIIQSLNSQEKQSCDFIAKKSKSWKKIRKKRVQVSLQVSYDEPLERVSHTGTRNLPLIYPE